eukprot:CAMPEP_0183313696 /NCGR_PEP_ID=MMETSP0160_2-20130417/46207_1 /TAXON_ID=2839 ORGANISM="Odontella Sinensis, Strain Grunow 1884" /NCGR_SAMPLE_ID=MMETSP0160_2 /ASSEMBLY_ACC=CAM_ASM_000250 /LENGTH=311 /DNA_ID=CAMNT_0025478837 /DNA_START=397 /DNA_END=1329 /DNA_ORIENTATION=-
MSRSLNAPESYGAIAHGNNHASAGGGTCCHQRYHNVSMRDVFEFCRADDWKTVRAIVISNPSVALTPMVMVNNISTTLLHRAITSKSSVGPRAALIQTILELSPRAAGIKNGYGSLPLHVVAQRNTKMDSTTKEKIILLLINAYPGALVQEGGVGKRTPLHIIFTDYVSSKLAKTMIALGTQATCMKDKKGWLPAHVACSRHCSPEKLQALLEANPTSLHETTNDGDTLLSLAISTATKAHPNYALIVSLKEELGQRAQCFAQENKLQAVDQNTPHGVLNGNKQPDNSALQTCEDEDKMLAQLLLYFHNSY